MPIFTYSYDISYEPPMPVVDVRVMALESEIATEAAKAVVDPEPMARLYHFTCSMILGH
jgi:hypothetical protein